MVNEGIKVEIVLFEEIVREKPCSDNKCIYIFLLYTFISFYKYIFYLLFENKIVKHIINYCIKIVL